MVGTPISWHTQARFCVAVIALAAFATAASAQVPSAPGADPDSSLQPLEIDGLVLDETQTPIGRDFFDAFRRFWRAPEGAYNYGLVVAEQPSPRRGTRVVVRVNDEVVYQAQVIPREEVVMGHARAGAQQAYRYLARSSRQPAYY